MALCLLLLLPVTALAAVGDSFTCYGIDLNTEQYKTVIELLGTDTENETLIPITIEDEKNLLSGVVDEEKMGTKSISSCRVTLLSTGSGIQVTTHNIDWVTANMYAEALSTAGVSDAKVVVAAPASVSGTAALAGIFKAYEKATETSLSSGAKALAGEELVMLGQLSDALGTDEAEDFLKQAKQYARDNGLTDPEKLKPMVIEYAKQLGLALTDDQIDLVTNLLIRIVEEDMSTADLKAQVDTLSSTLTKAQEFKEKATTFFTKVGDALSSVGKWFQNLFTKKTA